MNPAPSSLRRMVMRGFAVIACAVLAACQSVSPSAPKGAEAYRVVPAPGPNEVTPAYRIGAFDIVDITVFQEPDLSVKGVQVDAAGQILFPLIGAVQAAGMTSTELAADIAKRLGARFLENPQVAILVASSVSQKVTVEGAVMQPGVYEIRGSTTLLDAMAMSKGPTRTAALNEVIVFRDIEGVRNGAVFDVGKIRRGEAQDPAILGNDVVVVGSSTAKAAFRDFLSTVPLIAIFRPF